MASIPSLTGLLPSITPAPINPASKDAICDVASIQLSKLLEIYKEAMPHTWTPLVWNSHEGDLCRFAQLDTRTALGRIWILGYRNNTLKIKCDVEGKKASFEKRLEALGFSIHPITFLGVIIFQELKWKSSLIC